MGLDGSFKIIESDGSLEVQTDCWQYWFSEQFRKIVSRYIKSKITTWMLCGKLHASQRAHSVYTTSPECRCIDVEVLYKQHVSVGMILNHFMVDIISFLFKIISVTVSWASDWIAASSSICFRRLAPEYWCQCLGPSRSNSCFSFASDCHWAVYCVSLKFVLLYGF